MRPPAARRRSYHHGDARNALLAEALTVIDESRTPVISLRDVARRVGVSHAAAYRHFPGKAHLLATLAARGMYLLADTLEAASREWDQTIQRSCRRDPRWRICRLAIAYVRFALTNPAYFRAMFSPDVARKADHPDLRLASDAATEPLIRALDALAVDKLIRREHVRETAVSIWALVHGLAILALDGQLEEGRLHVRSRTDFAEHLSITSIAVARQLGLRSRPTPADL